MAQYFSVADAWNIRPVHPGHRRVRKGSLTLHYDAAGQLFAAWSYNTCIMARMPDGRPVVSVNSYSVATSGHQRKVQRILGYDAIVCESPAECYRATEADLVRDVMARGYQLTA